MPVRTQAQAGTHTSSPQASVAAAEDGGSRWLTGTAESRATALHGPSVRSLAYARQCPGWCSTSESTQCHPCPLSRAIALPRRALRRSCASGGAVSVVIIIMPQADALVASRELVPVAASVRVRQCPSESPFPVAQLVAACVAGSSGTWTRSRCQCCHLRLRGAYYRLAWCHGSGFCGRHPSQSCLAPCVVCDHCLRSVQG